MNPIEQYFRAVLTFTLCVDETLECDHSNKSAIKVANNSFQLFPALKLMYQYYTTVIVKSRWCREQQHRIALT